MSTVSREVRRFEKEQELTMFVREGKRIADLTPEGRGFIEHIKPAFQAFQIEAARASDVAEMILRRSAGTFMLGYSPLAPAAMLSEVRSSETYASQLAPPDSPTEAIETLTFIRLAGFRPDSTYAFQLRQDLVQIPVGEEPLCAVHPRKPGARTRVEIHLEELRGQPIYLLSSDREESEIEDAWYLNAPAGDSSKIVGKRIPRDRLLISCLIEEASPSCRSLCMLDHRQI